MAHRDTLIEAIAIQGHLAQSDAERVFVRYLAAGAIKLNASEGFHFTHGAFLDEPVIRDALLLGTPR